MIFEILSEDGKVQNTIIAEPDFVEKNYKGFYRDVTPKPVIEAEQIPIKTLEEKVDELIMKVDKLVAASTKG